MVNLLILLQVCLNIPLTCSPVLENDAVSGCKFLALATKFSIEPAAVKMFHSYILMLISTPKIVEMAMEIGNRSV